MIRLPRAVSVPSPGLALALLPFFSIKPTTSLLAHLPTTKGSPRSFFPGIHESLWFVICTTSAMPTQNLERGSLGWRISGEIVIREGGWRGAARRRQGGRATAARWAARWRGGCEARRVRRQRSLAAAALETGREALATCAVGPASCSSSKSTRNWTKVAISRREMGAQNRPRTAVE